MPDHVALDFETIKPDALAAMSAEALDSLPFGVIGIDGSGIAERYNATEARAAGLRPDTVIGVHFFQSVAQCMNNFMVAQRFEDEPMLDDIIPYVLTLRMRPTPVRMRLLADPNVALRFILIHR